MLALVGLTPGRPLYSVQVGFGGMVVGLEQHNPGDTCREAGSLLSHHHFLEKPGLSLPHLSMTKVHVHGEEGFDFIFQMIQLR